MDRLVCGDVGFGKTEVALRAAFVRRMNGKQVAVVVPTTLLARQHYKTFTDRFNGLPVECRRRPRASSRRRLKKVKAGLADGIDRHRRRHRMPCSARRSSSRISASSIVDEEQHFGVYTRSG